MIGRTVSHYRVLARLGEGGMGEVYLAEDLTLRRRVALKFVADRGTQSVVGHQLEREARAAAALDHPFICKVYETGADAGRPFIAMEYVPGPTLKELLARGPLPGADALRLAGEIAEALDFAHRHGVIHRDLKPSNVIVSDGHARVVDFGIARQFDVAGSEPLTTVTHAGATAGTVAYMAPEQLLGRPADARADVFAFGIVLHEMLSGRHPFLQATAVETAAAILNAAPPALPEPAQPELRGAPVVVLRCLQKVPEARYASLSSAVADLGVRDPDLPRRWWRPRRVVLRWGVAVAIAIAAVSAGVQFGPRWWRADPVLAFKERDWILIADVENLTGDAVFDRSLRVALEVAIAQSRFVNVFPRDRVRVALLRMNKPPTAPVDATLAAEVAQREGIRAVLVASVAQVGDSFALTGRLLDPRTSVSVLTESSRAATRDQVLPALDRLAVALRRRLGESLTVVSQQTTPLPKATTSSLDALELYAKAIGRTDDRDISEQLLRQAIAIDPDFAMAHAVLGFNLFLATERPARLEAEAHVAKGLSLVDRLTTRERLWIQAASDDARGNRERAVAGYRSYLAQYPDDTRVLFRLGWTYMAGLGQFPDAVAAFRQLTVLDPRDSAAWTNLGSSLSGSGQYQAANDAYEKGFAVRPEERFGMFLNHEYGFNLVRLGRLGEAQKNFEEMLRRPGANEAARGRRSLAFLQMYRGQYGAAIDNLQYAISINHAQGASVSEFRDRLILVTALAAKGRRTDADRELTEVSKQIDRMTLGPEWLGRATLTFVRFGRLADAERLLAMARKVVGDATTDSSSNRSLSRDAAELSASAGELALARGQPAAAVRALAQAAMQAGDGRTERPLAQAQAQLGNVAAAIAHYETLLALTPIGTEQQENWFAAHVEVARLYDKSGKPEVARTRYETLMRMWVNGDDDLLLRRAAAQVLARPAGR
jgi:tetratricopeptide (TPR) repeat protein/tRNA A-37 threonylcarbamoyl transferase component Bud32